MLGSPGPFFSILSSVFTARLDDYFKPLIISIRPRVVPQFMLPLLIMSGFAPHAFDDRFPCFRAQSKALVKAFTLTPPPSRFVHSFSKYLHFSLISQQGGSHYFTLRHAVVFLIDTYKCSVDMIHNIIDIYSSTIPVDGDATPNGLAMNLPILHDISCISYKDYKRSK